MQATAILDNMKIFITNDNTSVHYQIGNGNVSRRIKLRTQDNGRIYFVAKRKYYYLDQFNFV